MDNKLCPRCNIIKPLSDYHKRAKSKSGVYAYCKICARTDARKTYQENPEPYKQRAKEGKTKRKIETKEFIESIRIYYGCRVCPEKETSCLDFHHYNEDEKINPVVSMADDSLPKLINEILKCVILCANCHRKVHAGKTIIDESYKCNKDEIEKLLIKVKPNYKPKYSKSNPHLV